MLGLGNLGKRLAESVVALFAILGFLFVPLGSRTGFEHTRAVLTTPAAAAAIEDVSRAVLQLRQRAVDFMAGHSGDGPAPRAAPSEQVGPRPVPPKLK